MSELKPGKNPKPSVERVVVFKEKPSFHYRKPASVIGGVVALLIIVVVIVVWVRPTKPKTTSTQISACSSQVGNQLVTQAVPLLANQASTDIAQLKQIVLKIQAQSNYGSDPSCLYIVTQYYINIGNLQQAESYDKQLNAVYKPSQGFSTVLIEAGANPKSLSKQINYLKTLQTQVRKNMVVN